MFKVAILLLMYIIDTSNAEIYFKKECEERIIESINNANISIDMAIYSINNTEILNALYNSKNNGVKIRILTDRVQSFGKSSKVRFLHDMGFDIKIHSKDRIMHHKFAIFDNNSAVEGSFNWTNSAANKNSEDCHIFDKQEDIETLNERFKELWIKNKRSISECYFSNMSLSKNKRLKCK